MENKKASVSIERFGVLPEPDLASKWTTPKGGPRVRDPYTPYVDPGLDCSVEPSLTDQSQAKDCDVNVIVDRFMRTGVMPQMSGNPIYGDFSDPVSYQEALARVMLAEEQFLGLDAKTRARFDNDPARFLEFASDPKNVDAMVDMGLATRPAPDPVLGVLEGIREDLKQGRGPAEGGAPAAGPGGTPGDAKRRK